MCGILLSIGDAFHADFAAALATLQSRGPDTREVLVHGAARLGHARLAVIDPAGGRQPMTSANGRLAMVYNGEIYNFAALRRVLEAAGHAFTTRSDSEVLLTGYAHWGEAVVDQLDGMFAFAIHDLADGSVFLARDRLGIKPLFWGEAAGCLIAASTLAPFFAFSHWPKKLNPAGLRDYLACQTALAPQTLVKDVHLLPPGACLKWKPGAGSTATMVRHWWTIPDPSETHQPALNPADLHDEIDRLLAQAVKAQLVADVPLGAFLSGGIDSSLLVHYMAEAGGGGGAGAAPLQTFSVRFAERGFDESPAARAVAQQYGTAHHVLDAPELTASLLTSAIAALDQPLADPAYVPTWALARLTRQHVTVALSGDGGDELFGGYPRLLDHADQHPDSSAKRLLRRLIRHGLAPASLSRRALAGGDLLHYRRVELGDFPGSRKDLAAYLAPETARVAHPERTFELWRQLVEAHGGYCPAGLLRADLWTYLSENCLAKTDRASMAHGLEVRVPLLANALQDYVLRLPAAVHFDAAGGKALLRALARRHLPSAVWDRPKHGFSVPLASYFAGAWRALGDQYFAQTATLAPFLNAAAVTRLWQQARQGHQGRASRRLAYTFLVLLIWLEHHPLEA